MKSIFSFVFMLSPGLSTILKPALESNLKLIFFCLQQCLLNIQATANADYLAGDIGTQVGSQE